MSEKYIKNEKIKIYPVLTISTNTAEGRNLNRDSYILLKIPDQKNLFISLNNKKQFLLYFNYFIFNKIINILNQIISKNMILLYI